MNGTLLEKLYTERELLGNIIAENRRILTRHPDPASKTHQHFKALVDMYMSELDGLKRAIQITERHLEATCSLGVPFPPNHPSDNRCIFPPIKEDKQCSGQG